MSVAIERVLAPATGHPSRPPVEDVGQTKYRRRVHVGRLDARGFEGSRYLANSLGASITLVVPQIVPYPLPLESPPVRVEFNENHFRVMASKSPV
jgi:hypothetical protein